MVHGCVRQGLLGMTSPRSCIQHVQGDLNNRYGPCYHGNKGKSLLLDYKYDYYVLICMNDLYNRVTIMVCSSMFVFTGFRPTLYLCRPGGLGEEWSVITGITGIPGTTGYC